MTLSNGSSLHWRLSDSTRLVPLFRPFFPSRMRPPTSLRREEQAPPVLTHFCRPPKQSSIFSILKIVAVISKIQRLCTTLNSCWASLQSPLGHSRQIIKFKFNPFKSTCSYDVTGIPQSRSFGKSSILSQFLTNDSAVSPLRKLHSCLGGTAPHPKCWPWLEGVAEVNVCNSSISLTRRA